MKAQIRLIEQTRYIEQEYHVRKIQSSNRINHLKRYIIIVLGKAQERHKSGKESKLGKKDKQSN